MGNGRMIAFPSVMLMFAIPSAAATAMSAPAVLTPASPCNKVCTVEPDSALCQGCGRHLAEIAAWLEYSDAERSAIMNELPARLALLRRRGAHFDA
jgi:uncharacterized protein